jgi:2'-5' RNA ligase
MYWHILLQDKPQAVDLAREAQERLSSFSDLHMTPLERLHITTLLIGSTDSISSQQTTRILNEAKRAVASVQPISITLGQILYHPEAIMLRVHPQRALDPILNGIRAGMQNAIGQEGIINGAFPAWTPHITVAYSTADQLAAPIIDTLGRELPNCVLLVDTVSLVIQWGPERLWDWQTVGSVKLAPVAS